jgi:hypothetical protein
MRPDQLLTLIRHRVDQATVIFPAREDERNCCAMVCWAQGEQINHETIWLAQN